VHYVSLQSITKSDDNYVSVQPQNEKTQSDRRTTDYSQILETSIEEGAQTADCTNLLGSTMTAEMKSIACEQESVTKEDYSFMQSEVCGSN